VSKAIDKAAGVEREVIGTGKRSQNQSEGWDRPWKKEQMAEIGGSGMAKYNITAPATPEAHRWSGWGTALKPALEPITVARKPLVGTVAANVLAHGTGGINVDGCRVGTEPPAPRNAPKKIIRGGKFHASADAEQEMSHYNPTEGRWPANLIHDGSDEVTGLFPQGSFNKPAMWQSDGDGVDGTRALGKGVGRRTAGTVRDAYGDTGSAARFFYCAKAGKKDRGQSNRHPTVKPTTLMRYLCKLITPPGGLILDPFAGSGSTGRGAVLEGFRFVGMELDAEHVAEAKRRILEVQNGWTDEPEDEPIEDLPGQRLLF
jgi:site-specific DNA-methyltransferase (adenine-specific)